MLHDEVSLVFVEARGDLREDGVIDCQAQKLAHVLHVSLCYSLQEGNHVPELEVVSIIDPAERGQGVLWLKVVGIWRIVHENDVLHTATDPGQVLGQEALRGMDAAVLSEQHALAQPLGVESAEYRLGILLDAGREHDDLVVLAHLSDELLSVWPDVDIDHLLAPLHCDQLLDVRVLCLFELGVHQGFVEVQDEGLLAGVLRRPQKGDVLPANCWSVLCFHCVLGMRPSFNTMEELGPDDDPFVLDSRVLGALLSCLRMDVVDRRQLLKKPGLGDISRLVRQLGGRRPASLGRRHALHREGLACAVVEHRSQRGRVSLPCFNRTGDLLPVSFIEVVHQSALAVACSIEHDILVPLWRVHIRPRLVLTQLERVLDGQLSVGHIFLRLSLLLAISRGEALPRIHRRYLKLL